MTYLMSTNLSAVLQQLLQNTSNLKVLQQLMTPDATYVSVASQVPAKPCPAGVRLYLSSTVEGDPFGANSV